MSIWDIALQDWLQKIHRNMDDCSLFTSTYSPIELNKRLLNRVIDIAFLFEPSFVEDLITAKVVTVPLHLVSTGASDVNNVNQLKDFIMVDYGESVNAQYTREFQDSPQAKHFMSQPLLALNFILNVGGSAYLPRQMTFEYVRKNKLYIVENAPVYSRDIYANYLAKSQKVDIIEQALQLFPFVNV